MIKQVYNSCCVEFFHTAVFWMLLISVASGQNLIANSSFEDISSDPLNNCSISIGYSEHLDLWQGLNTVDFIHQDYPFSQRSGKQKILPNSGQGMVGLYLADAGDGWLPEFLFQKLPSGVKFGKKYRIGFFLHFRRVDGYFPSTITFGVIAKDPCNIPISSFSQEKMIDIDLRDSILSEEKWMFISKEFTAPSDGHYLIVGSFEKKTHLLKKYANKGDAGVYIFLDDLSLIPLEVTSLKDKVHSDTLKPDTSSIPPPSKPIPQNVQPNVNQYFEKMAAMPTISFDYNSSKINLFFQKVLLDLVPNLIKGNCEIIISGHTDNVGSDVSNQQLARTRAQVVAEFLIQKGLSKDKVVVQGLGSTHPISSGSDEFSKSMNRRVEIVKNCN